MEFTKKEDKEFDIGEWMYHVDNGFRNMVAVGIASTSSEKLASDFCSKEIRDARNYEREGNREKADRCIERLETVYPIATGEPLPKEIVNNIRKKYPK
jgi:hypothetical protein